MQINTLKAALITLALCLAGAFTAIACSGLGFAPAQPQQPPPPVVKPPPPDAGSVASTIATALQDHELTAGESEAILASMQQWSDGVMRDARATLSSAPPDAGVPWGSLLVTGLSSVLAMFTGIRMVPNAAFLGHDEARALDNLAFPPQR